MELKPYQRRTWAEIDLDAVRNNYEQVRNNIDKDTKICCVMKANAYGFGAVEMALFFEKIGGDYLAVSGMGEALQVREGGCSLPILILGYSDPKCAKLMAENNITACIYSEDYAKAVSEEAVKAGVIVKGHVKLDTGMGRLGFRCRDAKEDNILPGSEGIVRVHSLPGLEIEGVFTHFASSDEGAEGEEYTRLQFENFLKGLEVLKSEGIDFRLRHCANSAAIFEYPEMQLDMVRAGLVLYGLQPADVMRNKPELIQGITLHSVVDHLKEIKPGDYLGYGRRYQAKERLKVATIPAGYADGLWHMGNSSVFHVEIEGQLVPVIGKICFDQCMADVTGVDGVHPGSEVIIYGRRQGYMIDDIAQSHGRLGDEMISTVGDRVPRVYKEGGKTVAITDNLVKGI